MPFTCPLPPIKPGVNVPGPFLLPVRLKQEMQIDESSSSSSPHSWHFDDSTSSSSESSINFSNASAASSSIFLVSTYVGIGVSGSSESLSISSASVDVSTPLASSIISSRSRRIISSSISSEEVFGSAISSSIMSSRARIMSSSSRYISVGVSSSAISSSIISSRARITSSSARPISNGVPSSKISSSTSSSVSKLLPAPTSPRSQSSTGSSWSSGLGYSFVNSSRRSDSKSFISALSCSSISDKSISEDIGCSRCFFISSPHFGHSVTSSPTISPQIVHTDPNLLLISSAISMFWRNSFISLPYFNDMPGTFDRSELEACFNSSRLV